MQNPSVLQDWVCGLTFMQQSVLMTAIRAADNLPKTHPAKLLPRWLRRCILLCAFEKIVHKTADDPCPGKFTGAVHDIDRVAREYLVNVDELPHHYHLHVVHAAEIIGHKHPDKAIADWWFNFYLSAVNDMHMNPETKEEMEYRLGDVASQWKEKEKLSAED